MRQGQAARDQGEETAETKIAMPETNYELHTFPVGWEDVIVGAILGHDLYMDLQTATNNELATRRLMQLSIGSDRILDHWGSTDNALICEPYGDHDQQAANLATFLDVELITGEQPEWNHSCNRYRFEMRIPRYEDDAHALIVELVNCVNWEFRERCRAQDQLKELRKILHGATPNSN